MPRPRSTSPPAGGWSVNFSREINSSGVGGTGQFLRISPDYRSIFLRDPLESRAQSWFRQSGLCKIWFSKDLDLKILITNDLRARLLASPNCHGLDHCCAALNCGARSNVTMMLWKSEELRTGIDRAGQNCGPIPSGRRTLRLCSGQAAHGCCPHTSCGAPQGNRYGNLSISPGRVFARSL